MDDYISREAAVKKFTERLQSISTEYIRKIADEIPPADVRPVVYCKDCFAYGWDLELAKAAYLNPDEYCALHRIEMPACGFCSYGKRCSAKMKGVPNG